MTTSLKCLKRYKPHPHGQKERLLPLETMDPRRKADPVEKLCRAFQATVDKEEVAGPTASIINQAERIGRMGSPTGS